MQSAMRYADNTSLHNLSLGAFIWTLTLWNIDRGERIAALWLTLAAWQSVQYVRPGSCNCRACQQHESHAFLLISHSAVKVAGSNDMLSTRCSSLQQGWNSRKRPHHQGLQQKG